MSVTKRTRYEVLRRDGYACRYCGDKAPDVVLTVDHVVPVSLGGTDAPANLVAACSGCNAGKAASNPDASLVAQVADDALRWSAAMQAAAESLRADLDEDRKYADALDATWNNWHYGGNPDQKLPRPAGWRNSASAFRAAGLPVDLMVDSATRALSNDKISAVDTWKYFCGIAWKRVAELRERARMPLASTEPVERYCGHCHSCIAYANDPAAQDLYCYTYSEREPDEEPDECDICGGQQCAPGQARSAALVEGYEEGSQTEWRHWYDSYERLQLFALSRVVDGIERYGRAL